MPGTTNGTNGHAGSALCSVDEFISHEYDYVSSSCEAETRVFILTTARRSLWEEEQQDYVSQHV